MEKLMTLEEWAAAVYGAQSPHIDTLRRWAREARIYPAAEKHGRTYFVTPSARYVDPAKLAAVSAAAVRPRRGSLAEKIMQERGRGKTA